MSNPDDIEAAVHKIICEILGKTPDELGRQEPLAAHGWDSLASLEGLAVLESELGVTLDLRAFHAAHTVRHMAELVASELSANTR
ncbi:hypothetical protein GCM10010116_21550 [Microbispora rosea subsp. aerata]|nr:acyl carrier protein [Microbispora rosea]GGO10731.1 hypothetical protein GCM10010116_21550 [Microbispora rosea subsp. aerata]GIH53662.1 hypothetical protein Mro02_05760 [Microbispora rosea subsp. aerata]GLJ81655.1 hypothetical protein GCM10017588_03800 [Microbispora rosea subsp. aerata]